MNKKLLISLGSIVGILLIVYFGLSFFLGSVVKHGVNGFAPKLTETKVELHGAHISPFTGSGSLSGLSVVAVRSDFSSFSLAPKSTMLKTGPLTVEIARSE
jgi:hypothetical protein